MTEKSFADLSVLPTREVLKEGQKIAQAIEDEIRKVLYGPEIQNFLDMMINSLFADGHLIVRAPVGLGKTFACEALARTVGGEFKKRQFRPDMLPAELAGFEVYNQKKQDFEIRHGPLYGTNIFLADEINRGTPKAQSALLEAMEGYYLTIASSVFPLEPIFNVLATRNPMEHEGTYQLPEAQLDRFLAQPIIDERLSKETALMILGQPNFWRRQAAKLTPVEQVTTPEQIVAIREAIFDPEHGIHVENQEKYAQLDSDIHDLAVATWDHSAVQYGSSIRGEISLKKVAMVTAFRAGRTWVEPEDVTKHAVDVLAHRIFLHPEVRNDPATRTSAAQVIKEVLHAAKFT